MGNRYDKKIISIVEIFVLVFSLFAVSSIINDSFAVVSASTDDTNTNLVSSLQTCSQLSDGEGQICDLNLDQYCEDDSQIRRSSDANPSSGQICCLEKCQTVDLEAFLDSSADINQVTTSTLGNGRADRAAAIAKTLGGVAKKGSKLKGLTTGVIYAAATYFAVRFGSDLAGLPPEATTALSNGAAAGVLSGQWSSTLGISRVVGQALGISTTAATLGIGVVVGVVVAFFSYKKTKEKHVVFNCVPWVPETKGDRCEECNKQGLPCSEYQCRSLGQNCELLNKGTDRELCTWVHADDVNPPVIEPRIASLTSGYEYRPDNAVSPPDRGTIIYNTQSTDGCVPAWKSFTFGVELNESARCKIDYIRKSSFDEMDYFFGGNALFDYNFTQELRYPGEDNLEQNEVALQNNGEFSLYTICKDKNDNENEASFVFKYCIDKGEDITAPEIVTTDILDNSPIAYNQSSVDLRLFTDEPAECRWSHLDQDYDNMENQLSCQNDLFDYNAKQLYECSTTLVGLKDRQENKFYFRCQDKTNNNNTNTQSKSLTLIGTQPLVIDSISPNGTTIKDSSNFIKVNLDVRTSAGYKEGDSICYYSPTGDENYLQFFNTNSFKHSQELLLPEGDYDYSIRCVDKGGNLDTTRSQFTIETDTDAPLIVRALREENSLKIITSENASCVYDTISCNYPIDEGLTMKNIDEVEHFTPWKSRQNYYIKCADSFGNIPNPDECSIEVRTT